MNPVNAQPRGFSFPLKHCLLLVAIALSACGGGDKGGDKKAEEKLVPVELAPADVASVEPRVLARKLTLSGSLSPLVQATVKSKVAGELLAVNVREGDTARRGDVLARIDTRNQAALVASQRAALEKARADRAITRLNLDNNTRLLEKKFIAQSVLDNSRSSFDAANAGVRLAEAQLHLVEIGLQDAVVRAPISGVVARRLVQPGEKVSPDSPLLALVDLSHMELQAAAPAAEVPAIHPGQIAQVRVDGFGERRFEARVQRINPSAEQGSRSIMIYLAIDNPDGALKGGMFAIGELLLEQTEPVPAIPVAAVHSEAGLSYVLSVVNGKLTRLPVKLGLRSGDDSLVEVREGLALGAQVIVAKLDSLKPGAPVLFKAPEKPAAAKPADGG